MEWMPWNNMKVYGLNIRGGHSQTGGSNNRIAEKDDLNNIFLFCCSKMSTIQQTLKFLESLHVCLAFRGELWVPSYWIFWKINCSRLFLHQLWRRAFIKEKRDLNRTSFLFYLMLKKIYFLYFLPLVWSLPCLVTHWLTHSLNVMLLIYFYISKCARTPFLIYVSEFFHNSISLRQ